RFGLAAVKGVGAKAVEQIIAAREKTGRFKSLYHFCENVDLRAANKQVMESLIKAGAFDRLGGNRAQMMTGLEKAMQMGSTLQADKNGGQLNFFGKMSQDDYSRDYQTLPQVDPWPEAQMLAYEKDVLGFYVTSNPLSHCAETINLYSTANSIELNNLEQGQPIIIGGMVTKIRQHITKKGKNAGSKMAVFVLEDLQGETEVVLFAEALEKYGEFIVNDRVVFVKGKVDRRREKPNIFADEIISLEQATGKLAAKVKIKLSSNDISEEKIAEIRSICEHHRGKSPIYVAIRTDKGSVYAAADNRLTVNPNTEFCRKMKQLVGAENFLLGG
ncbi:MAG: OB-fold nucleic acid binding domain-containing protein, partial [Phycisphaerae bacterium]